MKVDSIQKTNTKSIKIYDTNSYRRRTMEENETLKKEEREVEGL
jgi:hypothetical protein